MESLTFESRDLARTEEFLNRAYTKMWIGGGTDDVSARITREAVASISIDRLDIGFEMKYDADPLGKICLCVVEAGTVQDHGTDGWEDAFGPGDVVSFGPPDRPYVGKVCRSRYSITMFDPALLTRAAGVDNRSGRPVRLLDHRPHSAAAPDTWSARSTIWAITCCRTRRYGRRRCCSPRSPACSPPVFWPRSRTPR